MSAAPPLVNRELTLVQNVVDVLLREQFYGGRQGVRDYDKECQYPRVITTEAYWRAWKRQGVVRRLIKAYPDASWSEDPRVFETDDSEETEWEAFFDKFATKRNLFHYLHKIDIQSGIGCFGVLLFGLNGELNEPIPGVEENHVARLLEDAPKKVEGENKLLYMRTFSERYVEVLEYESDTGSPRYGEPTLYNVQFNDGKLRTSTSKPVHWTRVLHVADNCEESEVFGTPRAEQCWNRFIDIRKIMGATGEGFWQHGFPTISVEGHKPGPGEIIDFDVAATKDELSKVQNSLQRYLVGQNASAKLLSATPADPTAAFMANIKYISMVEAIPMRVLLGSEEARLAADQDGKNFGARVNKRCHKYVGPKLLRPAVDRLMDYGVLPWIDEYGTEWDDRNAPTKMEKAEYAKVVTEALALFVNGGVGQLVDEQTWFTEFLGLAPDRAEAIVQAALDKMEEGLADKIAADAEAQLAAASQQGAPAQQPPAPKAGGNETPAVKPKRRPAPVENFEGQPRTKDGRFGSTGKKKSSGGGSGTSNIAAESTAAGYPPVNPGGKDLMGLHTDASGNFSEARTTLHNDIEAGMLAGKSAQAEPVYVFMGGGPASGKGSILKTGNVELPDDAVHLDPDEFKAKLPEYKSMNGKGDLSAAAVAHEESSYLTKRVSDSAVAGKNNVVLDGTGDSSYEKMAGKVEKAKAGGHRVEAHYVTVDTNEAIRRSDSRAARTGRMVPHETIRNTHASVTGVVRQAEANKLFDKMTLWDNNGSGDPFKVMEQVNGQTTIHDQGAYDKFLAKDQ